MEINPVEKIVIRYSPATRSHCRLLQAPWAKKSSWVLRVVVVELESSLEQARRPTGMPTPDEQPLTLIVPLSRSKVGQSHELLLSH